MDLVMVATSARGDTRLLHTTARRRVEEEGCGLVVVHVVGGVEYDRQSSQMRRAIRAEMRWLLHAMLVPAVGVSGSSIGRMTVDVREGDVVEQLIDAVESSRPDLVMLGVPQPHAAGAPAEDPFAHLIAYLDDNSIPVEQVPAG